MGVIEKIGRFLDPIIVVREDGAVLDAERQPSPAGAEEARRQDASSRCSCPTRRSRSRSWRSTPRRRTTCARSRSRRSGWRARSRRRQTRHEDAVRLRVRAAVVPDARRLLRGATAPERRRVSVDPAARRRVPRRADREGAQGTRAARQEDPEAGRRRDGGRREAEGQGLTSPYLKPFVVSRVNYTRFSKATSFDFDEALDKIIASAPKFNVDRVKQEDVAKAGGRRRRTRVSAPWQPRSGRRRAPPALPALPPLPGSVERDKVHRLGRLGAELPNHRRHLPAVVGRVVDDVLEHVPED